MATPANQLGKALKTDTFGMPDVKSLRSREDVLRERERLIPERVKAETEIEKSKLGMESDIAAAKARTAEDFARQEREQYGKYEEAMKKEPLPKFEMTEDTAKTMGSLFSITATLGIMLGASGKTSANRALAAMTGMLQGWQAGRKDLYQREKANYEKEFARVQAVHADLRQTFNDYVKLLSTDREAAMLKGEELARKAGSSSVLAAMEKAGNLKGIESVLDSAEKIIVDKNNLLNKIEVAQAREAGRMEAWMMRQGFGRGASGMVKDFFGIDLAEKQAEPVVAAATAIGNAKRLQEEVRKDPGIVGREGQVRQFVNRYIDSVLAGEAPPSDAESGLTRPEDQKALRFAKDYAAYLVDYERSLAPGARGFTVSFQQRFNNLMKQDQFNAAGMIELLNDQQREVATRGTQAARGVTRAGLEAMGADIIVRAQGEPLPVAKPMPTGETLSTYAKEHFDGNEEAAKAFLRTQGYQ